MAKTFRHPKAYRTGSSVGIAEAFNHPETNQDLPTDRSTATCQAT
ncbi:hypothetical protein ACFPFV_03190 [Salinicoccus siamensis]